MAALTKEYFLDMALSTLNKANRINDVDLIDLDLRMDLLYAIEQLVKSEVFTYKHVVLLNMYISGYTATEIAKEHNMTTNDVEEQLTAFLVAIEYYSSYTDDHFVKQIEKQGKYSEKRINEMRVFLNSHGKRFMTHETPLYFIED